LQIQSFVPGKPRLDAPVLHVTCYNGLTCCPLLLLLQELVGPGNLADVTRAACDTNSTVAVHLHLYKHYERP
jgi:hypothetical protein